MTATDPRTLDDLLRAAEPVDAEPFDLDWYVIQPGTRTEIARHINSLRLDAHRARDIAVALEQECADKDRRIAEAVRWLERAESYSLSEDCSSAIDDAMAALRGAS